MKLYFGSALLATALLIGNGVGPAKANAEHGLSAAKVAPLTDISSQRRMYRRGYYGGRGYGYGHRRYGYGGGYGYGRRAYYGGYRGYGYGGPRVGIGFGPFGVGIGGYGW
jgi:hypothetical protein